MLWNAQSILYNYSFKASYTENHVFKIALFMIVETYKEESKDLGDAVYPPC